MSVEVRWVARAGLLVSAVGCCEPELIAAVPNTLHPQETANWCWAATTEMLADPLGIAVDQCDLANDAFGRTDCCNLQDAAASSCQKTDLCNSPGWPQLDHVGLAFDETNSALTWDEVRSEIYCGKTSMGYGYGTEGVVGHVLVVKGYATLGGTNYVVLNDPWSPCMGQERLITYAEYADPAGSSTHWSTFYNVALKP